MAANPRLELTRYIAANRATVFKAWTNPEWVRQWFAPGDMTVPEASVDATVGGKYRIHMQNSAGESFITSGEYQHIVPNEKLVFTWGWEGPDRYDSLVTVLLKDLDEGTELTLIHERLTTEDSAQSHGKGWRGCLDNLARRIHQLNG